MKKCQILKKDHIFKVQSRGNKFLVKALKPISTEAVLASPPHLVMAVGFMEIMVILGNSGGY